jgi:hypothetical protein
MDPLLIARTFKKPGQELQHRAGTVVSVQNNRTITITVAGSTQQIAGIRYLGDFAPQPGKVVRLLADGADLFAIGHMAFDGGTLAPRASRSTNQNIADNTEEAITFDGVNSDPWGCWSSGQATRLTAPLTGRYVATASVQWAGNATGYRRILVEKTGTSTVGRLDQASASAANPTWQTLTTAPFDMTAGTDYIRLIVRQNSGGVLAATNSSTYAPALSFIYLGP